MAPDRPEREGRLHAQLLELESIRSAGLLSAAEHKSKREAVISRWEESLRKREELETTLDENKAKTQQLLHALRATVKHGSDLLSKKQMAGVRQAYLELTGLSSLPSAVPKLRDLCARFVAENFVPRRGRAGPSGAKRREEDALDNDRETWGSWSLPDEPLDDLEDSGAPAPAPVTPDEVPPAPTEEEEPQEPEEKARRREWEAAGVGGTGAAGIVPKRPRRERKASNPYVPVDFRPPRAARANSDSGLGCSRCRFSKGGCATCRMRIGEGLIAGPKAHKAAIPTKKKGKSAARGLMLQALMKEGLMEPGQGVLRVDYKGHVFLGDLMPSGSICYEGKLWGSLTSWSGHVKRSVVPSYNGHDSGWDSVFYVAEDGEETETTLKQLKKTHALKNSGFGSFEKETAPAPKAKPELAA